MKINKIIIIILFIAFIFSLKSTILLVQGINKLKEEGEAKPNKYICEKKETIEGTTQIYRDEISYDDNNLVTDFKTGNVIEFASKKELDKFIEKNPNNKIIILDDNKVFNYDNFENEIKGNDGNTYSIWFKYSVNSRIEDGYNCYRGE